LQQLTPTSADHNKCVKIMTPREYILTALSFLHFSKLRGL
jgi:hypothetical protein